MRVWKNHEAYDRGKLPDGLHHLFFSEPSGIFLYNHEKENSNFEWMAAFGTCKELNGKEGPGVFNALQNFLSANRDWAFGHFSYDLKNSIEKLESLHFSGIDFPVLRFFVPELVAIQSASGLKTGSLSENEGLDTALFLKEKKKTEIPASPIRLFARTSRENYLEKVQSILEHIRRGDIYELNFCIEFFAENASIDPVEIFRKLVQLTEAPFSALYKNDEQWLICASPERFMQKKGSRIISQPIKGTRPRGKTNHEDERLKTELLNDRKERSENVMIVDLVRNDLSKSAKKNSVKVDELFGIHTFKNVHQMISTISAELPDSISPVEAIKNAFPMGSMTGAPKVRAMELTEEFENMRRGLYAGAVGYFTPEMDFDFNVVIRSIQYNAVTGYLSLMVGSAITAESVPEKEYEECLVKAKTLFQALGVEWKD